MSSVFPNKVIVGTGIGTLNSIAKWNSINEIIDSDVYIDNNNQISVGSAVANDAMLDITCRATNITGLKIKAAENQTADLLKIVNSDESCLFVINYKGDQGITICSPNEPLHVQSDYDGNRAIRMGNESNGSSAVGRFIVDVLGGSTFLAGYGSNFTTSGSKRANSGSLIANAAMEGGLSLVARHPTTGHVRIYSGGNADTNERVIIEADGTTKIGDLNSSHYTSFASNGFITLVNNAKIKKVLTFNFNHTIVSALGKPTSVSRGAFQGYSLPIYNNDNEELFSCKCVPGGWDGISDPVIYIGGWLDTANNAKRFNLQVSVEKCDMNGNEVVQITTNDYTVETLTGDVAQYTSYKIAFTCDASAIELNTSDALAIRIRRLAASSDEISGEFVVEGAVVEYIADKLGGTI